MTVHNEFIAPCGALSAADKRWTLMTGLASVIDPLLEPQGSNRPRCIKID